jgi:hypothetical protein
MPVTRCRKVVYHPTKQLGLGGAAMSTNGSTEARKLRSRLDHPIIDADGHWIEYLPVMREEFRRIGGDAAVEALAVATDRVPNALRMSLPERQRRRVGMEAFWSSPSENVLDRATAMLPRLMYERLDDLGIDFCVPDMTDVVPEAYELVEHELISSDDFRDFMFTNAVRFWGEVNPDFFKGTAVEKQAAETLARPASVAAVR